MPPSAILLLSLACVACTERGYVLSLPLETRDAGTPGDTVFYDMGVAPGGCDSFTPGTSFGLCAATYVGGAGEDRADGVAFDRNGNVLVAARLSETPFELTPRRLGAGEAGILRLGETGRAPLSWTPLASRIRDISVGASDGRIALATEDGIVVLDEEAREILWTHEDEGGAQRVDVGRDGSVVGLMRGGTIVLLTPDGSPRTAFAVTTQRVEDIALDTEHGLIHVAGGRQTDGCPGLMPYLRAYGVGGREQWRRFDFDDADGHCGSAWGVRVALGADGQLYYAGQNEGVDTPHLRDPQDVRVPGPIVALDPFSHALDSDEPFGFFARFDPESGQMDRGQMLLARDGQTGGRVLINDITADASGHIFVVGESGCCSEDRDMLRVGGMQPGEFDQRDLFLAVFAPQLDARLSWVVFTGDSGSNAVATGVAVGRQFAALVGNQMGDQAITTPKLITHAALAPEPLGSSDAFVAVWPAP